MNKNPNEILGARIQNIRLAKRITQEKLANRVDISSNFISDMERGIKKPNVLTLIKLIQCLNTIPNEIFCDFVSINDDTVTEIVQIVSSLPKDDAKMILDCLKTYNVFKEKSHQ